MCGFEFEVYVLIGNTSSFVYNSDMWIRSSILPTRDPDYKVGKQS